MKERVGVKNPYIFRYDLILAREATAVQRKLQALAFKKKARQCELFIEQLTKSKHFALKHRL